MFQIVYPPTVSYNTSIFTVILNEFFLVCDTFELEKVLQCQ